MPPVKLITLALTRDAQLALARAVDREIIQLERSKIRVESGNTVPEAKGVVLEVFDEQIADLRSIRYTLGVAL